MSGFFKAFLVGFMWKPIVFGIVHIWRVPSVRDHGRGNLFDSVPEALTRDRAVVSQIQRTKEPTEDSTPSKPLHERSRVAVLMRRPPTTGIGIAS